MRPSGYRSLRADDPDVVVRVGAVLQAVQPAVVRDDVGVEQDDVVRGVGGAQAAVGVGGEADVLLAEDEPVDAVDRLQRGDVRGVRRRVVGDDDRHEPALRRARGCCARPRPRTRDRRRSG